MQSVVFQQDGAPLHYGVIVRDLLKKNLSEDRIIARGVGTVWPPRSPDLTPLDYWFWGMVKARVYHSFKRSSLEDLQQRISMVISEIEDSELENAVMNIIPRLRLI